MEFEHEMEFYGGGEVGESPLRARDMVPLVEREAAPTELAEFLDELQFDPIWHFEVTMHTGDALQFQTGGLDIAHLRAQVEAAGKAPRYFVPTVDRPSWLMRAKRVSTLSDGTEVHETRKEYSVQCKAGEHEDLAAYFTALGGECYTPAEVVVNYNTYWNCAASTVSEIVHQRLRCYHNDFEIVFFFRSIS